MVLTFTKYKEINSFGIQNRLYFSIPLFFFTFYNLHISFLSVKFSMLHLTETW